VAIAYVMYAAFVLVARIFAQSAVAAAVLQAPDVRCKCSSHPGAIAGLPVVLVAYITTFSVIPATPVLAIGIGVGLLILDGVGWRLAWALFNRERLITGTR
jgi:ABC-2 type transport system permease protein